MVIFSVYDAFYVNSIYVFRKYVEYPSDIHEY